MAIGNAGGQGFPSTVTAGAVTALNRTITASNDNGGTETLSGMIQMDALIEPGNSGGPLVNSSGDVIGLDTAAASADGATPIGFALPIDRVVKIANEIEHGHGGNGIVIGTVAFLGVAGAPVSIQGGATGFASRVRQPGQPGGTGRIASRRRHHRLRRARDLHLERAGDADSQAASWRSSPDHLREPGRCYPDRHGHPRCRTACLTAAARDNR